MSTWFEMGQYGAFVWSAYGISMGVLLGNVMWAKYQQRKMLKKLKTFFQRSSL